MAQRNKHLLLLLGIAGASFLYGDAAITPALSVISAVEGLKVIAPAFEKAVVPLSIVILIGLFAMQGRGTARVAALFGPIIMAWFAVIAIMGVVCIAEEPRVLAAFNPIYGATFLFDNGLIGLTVLGLVFLAVTGAEALYADLGHFGRKPIQAAWLGLALPALTFNYFGQGALVLGRPTAIENPFFLMFPSWALWPIVLLSTAATVIASQAVITGAYSITRQAVQLGLLPRFSVRHTSEEMVGSDLRTPRQLAVAHRGVATGGHLQELKCARRCVRSCCYCDDDHHLVDGLFRLSETVEVASVAGSRPARSTPIH